MDWTATPGGRDTGTAARRAGWGSGPRRSTRSFTKALGSVLVIELEEAFLGPGLFQIKKICIHIIYIYDYDVYIYLKL